MLFADRPLVARAAAARAAGFSAVEFWWPFNTARPEMDEVRAFEDSISAAGVRLSSLNFWAGDMAAGERGVLSSAARSDEFRASVQLAVQIGNRLGCRMFNAPYGNREAGVTIEDQDQVALENLVYAARAVAAIDGVLLLEPLSGSPTYPLRTAEDVLEIAARVTKITGLQNVRLLADLFHLAMNGCDVAAVIAQHVGQFGHIQIADAPQRGEPGTGKLPILDWLSMAAELGYDRMVSLEYRALTGSPFAWLYDSGLWT